MAICNEWVVKRLDNHLRQYLRLPIERDKEASKVAPFGQQCSRLVGLPLVGLLQVLLQK